MCEGKYILQAELIRRQVEVELDGDSNEELTYIFKADDSVSPDQVNRFMDKLSDWGYSVIIYYDEFEDVPEDELRETIKDLAPEVGLHVEEQ